MLRDKLLVTDTIDYYSAPITIILHNNRAPYPDEAVLRAITPGIPAKGYPSDHLAVVTDLELRTAGASK
jgi:hypothetical protein